MLHLSYTQYIFLPLDQNAIKLSFSTLGLEKKVTLFDVAVRQSSRCLWFKEVQSDNFGWNQIIYCKLLLAKLAEHQLSNIEPGQASSSTSISDPHWNWRSVHRRMLGWSTEQQNSQDSRNQHLLMCLLTSTVMNKKKKQKKTVQNK